MPFSPGTRLGPYEIVSPLGAGGMGDVYRARDVKLHRDVAIKLLSSRTETDPAALDRFEREARAVAALNHPNIVTIYGVDEFEGRAFLAMELVDGQTLADIVPRGGLPLDRLLKYAIPLADALSAAHAQGITHRDLKPTNVMISRDDRVKVLDFGLAKLTGDVMQVDGTIDATRPLTGQGQILGTVSYMSPEQASGGAVDPRSDLFSLGVVLYEMATGDRPFIGDSGVTILASILKDTPKPITELRPQLPRDLGRMIRRALAKDPEQRYQTAKDLRNDLQTLRDDLTSGDLFAPSLPAATSAAAASRRKTTIAAVAAAAAAAAAVTGGFLLRDRRPAAAPKPETLNFTRLTSTGHASLAAISPDGKYVVHVVSENGQSSLWMRQTATSSNVQIVAPAPGQFLGLAFSPDGDYVYFTRAFETRLTSNAYRVPVLGGTPQPIVRDVDSPLSFSPDGTRAAFIRGYPQQNEVSVVVVAADGSGPQTRLATRRLVDGFTLVTRAAWSPDGKTIAVAAGANRVTGLVTTAQTNVFGIDVSTGAIRPLAHGRWDTISNLAWSSDGTLVVSGSQDGKPNAQLWRVASDGRVTRLTNDLNTYPDIDGSSKSRAIVSVIGDLSSTISILEPGETALTTRVTTGTGRYDGQTGMVWTADNRLVFSSAVGGQTDLWMVDRDGRNARQLTADPAAERQPVITPDGTSVVFVGNRQGQEGIWRLNLASGVVTRVTDNGPDVYPQCLPDNRTVIFTRADGAALRVFRAPLEGGPAALMTDVEMFSTALSRDGRRLAATVLKPATRILVTPLDNLGTGPRLDIASAPVMLDFAPRGDVLTFLETHKGSPQLWNQPLDGGPPRLLLDLHGERIFSFAWSPEGRLAVAHGPVPTDVVLVTVQ